MIRVTIAFLSILFKETSFERFPPENTGSTIGISFFRYRELSLNFIHY